MNEPTYYTLKTAAEEFANMPDDILPGWISSQSTILYGMSGVGKGRLIAELCSTGLNGEPFAGVEWKKPLERIAVLATDAGGPREYFKRLVTAGVGIEHELSVRIYPLAAGATAQEWAELTSSVLAWHPSLVIVDSTTEACSGSVNEDTAVRELWRNLTPFHTVRSSVPMLLVHHVAKPSLDNGGRRGQTPIGSGLWEALSRNKILLRPGFAGDGADATAELRPRFAVPFTAHFSDTDDGRLIHAGTTSGEEIATKKRVRRDGTRERNAAVAAFVIADCQGLPQVKTAAAIALRFPEISRKAQDRPRAIAQQLSKRQGYGALLQLDGATWSKGA